MDRLERLTLAQVARYPSTPPAEMWPVVRRELNRVKQALSQRQALSIQRRLVTVAGVLAGVAGNLSVDFGQPTKAYEYFDLGRLAGEEAGDDDLVAWSLALQSIDPFFRGSPRHAAELLEHAAVAGARSSARRRAWIEALRARAYAATGDRPGALRGLDAAYNAIDTTQPANATDFFDRDRLDGIAGTTHLLLRNTSHAEQLITCAIERRPHGDVKGRALLTLDQAALRIIDGEPEDAGQLVHSALDMASGQLVRPIGIRARHVRAGMARLQGTESLKALDERLRTLPI